MNSLILFQLLQTDLEPLVEEEKGLFSLAGDAADVQEQLGNGPVRWRLILGFDDLLPVGHGDTAQSLDFSLTLQSSRGLAFAKGWDLLKARAADKEPPFLFRVEMVMSWMRAMTFVSPGLDCRPPLFLGSNWVPGPGSAAWPRTKQLRFRKAYDRLTPPGPWAALR